MSRQVNIFLWILGVYLVGILGCTPQTVSFSKQEKADKKSEQVGELGDAEAFEKQAKEYHSNHNYVDSIFLYQTALQIKERKLGNDHPETAETMRKLAENYRILGYFDKALPLARQALTIHERYLGLENLNTAKSMRTLAWISVNQAGYSYEALSLAEKALQITEKIVGLDHLEVSSCLYTLAEIFKQMGSYEQALNTAQRGLNIRQRILRPEHPDTSNSFRQVGFIYLSKKNYPLAEANFQKATFFRGGKEGLVELYLATGRYEDALGLLQQIQPYRTSGPVYHALYYTLRGLALKGIGKYEEGASALLKAIHIIEDMRSRTQLGQRVGFFGAGRMISNASAYQGLIANMVEMSQKNLPVPHSLGKYGSSPEGVAFYFAEAIKARSLLEAMATSVALDKSQQLPGNLAEKERRLLNDANELELRIDELSVRDKAESLRSRQDSLRDQMETFIADLRRRVPRYAALKYPRPYQARELILKSGEVLLEYSLGEKESYIFRVEPGGKTQVFRLPLGQEALEKRISPLLAPFRQSDLKRQDLDRFSLREAAALYHEILAPAMAGLAPGTHVIIVPDGVLGAFPFEALVVEAGRDWKDSVFLGDRWPVTYSQSAAILALNRILGISKASHPLFALGDCIYEKDSPRYQSFKAGKGQAGELRHAGPERALTMAATKKEWGQLRFPPLPETRQTVTDLATLFQVKPHPPQVLLDIFATETKVRQAPLGQYRYLFFGTHGFLVDKIAGVQEPTLVLTQVENKPPDDGFLSFSKVLQLKLDAELVTLAACMTGVGQVMQGEGVLNFARAFQQAGARSVMVALWNIPVDESMKFYSTFYKALKEGKTKLQALQAARQAVRAKEPHPYFWSGLILHGEG
jgi:CHAT domain-containing protein